MSTPAPYAQQQRLIAALCREAAFPHQAFDLQLIETHISWVVLAGPFAYKLKKGIDLGFLDYSTLAQRHHFCEEELRLNRRTAPSLYLAVVAISGPAEQPRIGGDGPAIEWAVKMTRFEQSQLASQRLAAGQFTPRHLDHLARATAAFHRDAAPAAASSPFGSVTAIDGPIEENFRQLREQLGTPELERRLHPLEQWCRQQLLRRAPLLELRKNHGFIRECHGDLHLNNIVVLDEEPVPFDGIEFNDNLRYVDVVSDIAFLLMDLDYRQRSGLGWRFLDGYLQANGDYGGLALLRFYQVYRAMVRAKVAAIRAAQPGLGSAARRATRDEVDNYLRLALSYTQPPAPTLVITHGFSGSGKSSVALELLEQWGAVRLRSDVERKRLFGLAAEVRSHSALASGLYSGDASRQTYDHLARLAGLLLDSGLHVIVDATFLRRDDRAQFIALAESHGLRWQLLDVTASDATMRERIIARHAQQHDASEADRAVLDYQLQHHDPLTATELSHCITVATDTPWSCAPIVEVLGRE